MDPARQLAEKTFKLTVRHGTVYYFVHYRFTSIDPHYFIVMNAKPNRDDILLLTAASSQIQSIKDYQADWEKTVVILEENEYESFTKISAINCNNIIEISREQLIRKWVCKEIRHHADMPPAIMNRLIQAVRESRIVSSEHKRLICPVS